MNLQKTKKKKIFFFLNFGYSKDKEEEVTDLGKSTEKVCIVCKVWLEKMLT